MQKASLYFSSKSLKVLAPKLRFPEFTEPWKKAHIRDLGKILTGDTPSPKSKEYYGGEYLWVTPSDINGKETYTTKKKLSTQGLKNGRKVPKNSVLVTCIASIGKNTILREDGSCNQQINAIVVKDNYDLEFIYYLICRNEKLLHDNAGKGGMEIINKEQFSNIIIWIPNINEEKKISRLLSSIDKMIDTHQQKIKLLNMYKRGVLNQIFGQMTVDQISIKLKEVINPLKKTVHQAEEGKKKGIYPFFTNSTRNTQKYIDAYDYDDCVIIANTGGNAKFRYFDGKFAATSDCYIFKTNQNTQYIYYLLEYMTDRISKRGFRGNGIKHLDKAWFLNMDINIHLSEKQEQIASFLSMLDVRIQKEEHILEQLKMIKTGLLQQMFV